MPQEIQTGARKVQPVVIPAFCRIRDEIDFYAVTADLSLQGVRLRAARIPRPGDILECRIRNVDPFEGRVVRVSSADFTLRVGGASPGTVARQLLDAARRQASPDETLRAHRRFVPNRSAVLVAPANGRAFDAEILNVSASGAAIETKQPMEIGSLVTLGSTQARVMREFAGGFGAAFLQPFDPGEIDADLIL